MEKVARPTDLTCLDSVRTLIAKIKRLALVGYVLIDGFVNETLYVSHPLGSA